jgi:hypothetical protein
MNRKFLITLALACIVVAVAPSSGRDARPASAGHATQR